MNELEVLFFGGPNSPETHPSLGDGGGDKGGLAPEAQLSQGLLKPTHKRALARTLTISTVASANTHTHTQMHLFTQDWCSDRDRLV